MTPSLSQKKEQDILSLCPTEVEYHSSVEVEQKQEEGTGSIFKRTLLAVLETLRIYGEDRRRMTRERNETVNRIRRETEINRRYLHDQMEQRKKKLELLTAECAQRLAGSEPEALRKSLEAITEISLVPPAIIEFPATGEGTTDEGEEKCGF